MPLHIPSTGSTWSVQSVVLDPTLPELTSSLNQSSENFKISTIKKMSGMSDPQRQLLNIYRVTPKHKTV